MSANLILSTISMSNCPTCSNEFDSDRAMKIHHAMSHGESLAKEITTCKECGQDFSYYPSEKDGIYCPDCISSGVNQNISYIPQDKLVAGLSGEDNPNYSGGEFVTCDYCGDETYVSPSKIEENDHQFCDKKCYRLWQSENYQGEGNPFWKGGYTPNYSKGWWSAKRKTLERDNYECQSCGEKESSNGRTCDVHHKKPVRTFDNPSDAHFLENLVTLCRSCHSNAEMKNRKI